MKSLIAALLKKACDSGEIEEITRYQCIDVQVVISTLEDMWTNKDRMAFLNREYPCLSVYVMEKTGMVAELT